MLNKASTTISLQDFTFCGPREESCVTNQTLRDRSCLIPCSGLYADAEDVSGTATLQEAMHSYDYSFEQKVITGSAALPQIPFLDALASLKTMLDID